jgi:ABC-type nitrate/sulfonate/bicarbonate transport system substrate-binding protein
MTRKRCFAAAAFLMAAMLLIGAGASGSYAQTADSKGPAWAGGLSPLPGETVVKVGMKQVVSDAGVLIGMAKGYYKDLGIVIEPVQFNSGQEMINALAAGQLDVGAAVTAAGLFNAMSRDIPMKIVADKGINVPGKGYYRLVVRKGLADKLKDFKDLRGLKIAVVGTASLDEISLVRVLEAAKLTRKDIDMQVIRSFPDMLVALANGSIDAAMLIEPFVAQGIAKGILDPWKDPESYDPDAQTALLIYGTSMTKQPELARRFMVAYIKSIRDYNDAFFKGESKKETIEILMKFSVVKDPALYDQMFPVGLNPDGYVRMKGIDMDLQWYKENNLLQKEMKAEDAVDNQYVDFALKQIGKYR